MIRLILILFAIVTSYTVVAQSTLKAVMDSIRINNLVIKASSQNRDAEVVMAKTGLTPVDPVVDYGYFPGDNPVIGTKTTLNVTQSFYFPTVYSKKKTGATLSAEKSGSIHLFKMRQVLFQAAAEYVALVYLTNFSDELKKRVKDAENASMLAGKRLQTGDANQLEINKARMEALRWTNELRTTISRIEEKRQVLTAMNGGKALDCSNPEYPLWQILPVDSIYAAACRKDPLLKALEYDQKITANNVKLQNYLWIPQFKAGYGQETITEGTYRGIHAGISIPVWQNKNNVKSAQLQNLSAESSYTAYLQQMKSAIESRCNVVLSMKTSMDEYKKVVESTNSRELLLKSLQTGNISLLEYYRELTGWYETFDRYLISQKDYYAEMMFLMQFEM